MATQGINSGSGNFRRVNPDGVLRICVLASSGKASNSPFAQYDDYETSPQHWFPQDDPQYQFEFHRIEKATALQQVRLLALSQKFDAFVNMCDGAWDEDRAGQEVVTALEYYKVPFTGGDSNFYEPSKEMMKMVAVYEDILTPAFVFAYSERDIDQAVKTLKLPVIVKHFNGYSSVGMKKISRCETEAGLRQEARRIISLFGGALIEEFIEGREATVLVTESYPNDCFSACGSSSSSTSHSNHPCTQDHQLEDGVVALAPVECVFPDGETFKHFDIKWLDYDNMSWKALPGEEMATLGRQLQKAARDIFRGLHGVSYGRADFRIGQDGRIYFLEMNPNCGLFYPKGAFGSADFILEKDSLGHRRFAEHIIQLAIYRHQQKWLKTTARVTYCPGMGYHLRAARDLKAGELIYKWESNAQYVVSKSYIDREYSAQWKAWFYRYAYPISDAVWVTWSPHPEDWKPINHSCDPNTWLSGKYEMDLVARRDIPDGEQLTIDYCTFCVENMQAFECPCKSPRCRGTIRGTDYRSPELQQAYGSHVSSYIHSKWVEMEQQHSPSSSAGTTSAEPAHHAATSPSPNTSHSNSNDGDSSETGISTPARSLLGSPLIKS